MVTVLKRSEKNIFATDCHYRHCRSCTNVYGRNVKRLRRTSKRRGQRQTRRDIRDYLTDMNDK